MWRDIWQFYLNLSLNKQREKMLFHPRQLIPHTTNVTGLDVILKLKSAYNNWINFFFKAIDLRDGKDKHEKKVGIKSIY